jgi:hypothetical protein
MCLSIIWKKKKVGTTIEQVKIFEQIVKENKAIDIEYLYLKDYNVKECVGCNRCFNKGEKYCPLNDDREKIIEKINNVNTVIWVSPVYSMQISYILKKLVDRHAFLHHRPIFFNKKAFIIVVKGKFFPDSIKYLKSNLKSWGFTCINSLGIPAIINMPERIKNKNIKKIKKVANNFIHKIEQVSIKSPGIMQIVFFKMWKMHAELKDVTNADYMFFKENNLFKKNYFYKVQINIFKRIISALLFKFLILYLKNELGDLKKGL